MENTKTFKVECGEQSGSNEYNVDVSAKKKLGSGANAIVYEVSDDSTLCIKVFNNKDMLDSSNEETQAKLEYKSLVTLHKSVPGLFPEPKALVSTKDRVKEYGIVMTKISDTFNDILESLSNIQERIELLRTFLTNLKMLHEAGCVHGDLSLKNIHKDGFLDSNCGIFCDTDPEGDKSCTSDLQAEPNKCLKSFTGFYTIPSRLQFQYDSRLESELRDEEKKTLIQQSDCWAACIICIEMLTRTSLFYHKLNSIPAINDFIYIYNYDRDFFKKLLTDKFKTAMDKYQESISNPGHTLIRASQPGGLEQRVPSSRLPGLQPRPPLSPPHKLTNMTIRTLFKETLNKAIPESDPITDKLAKKVWGEKNEDKLEKAHKSWEELEKKGGGKKSWNTKLTRKGKLYRKSTQKRKKKKVKSKKKKYKKS